MIFLEILIACLFIYAAIGAAWEHTEYQRMEFLDFISDIKEQLRRRH